MGVSSPADPGRPEAARRSIRSTFAVRVAVPAACLALLWLLALAAGLHAALAGHPASAGLRILAGYGVLAAGGLAAIAAAVVLIGSFGRRLSRELSSLAAAAGRLASPAGGPAGAGPAAAGDGDAALADVTTAEVADAIAAITALRQRAAVATASESGLRDGLRQVFVSLAKRNQSLLQRQLRLIDTLEQKASDPAALADLFALDHLTTRMRRHAESLAILSGAAPGRSWRDPVPVIDVIRGAVAEVEDYRRVAVLTDAEDAVVGPAVADMIHLLAELVENATLYSPSGTQVEIRAGRVANGFAVEIDDRGLGIEPDQLREINQQLASPPDFDLADADRLGLFVGAKLAARHGVRVSLRASPYGGTSAIALMPSSIVLPGELAGAGAPAGGAVPRPGEPRRPGARAAVPRPARLDLSGAAALALAGRRSAQPPDPSRQPVSTAEGLPSAASLASAITAASPVPRPAAIPPRDAPAGASPARGSLAGITAPGTHAGLPRRVRQASLSPHLRDGAAGAGLPAQAGGPPAPPVARTPERARDLAASVQSAWQRSRAAEPAGGGETDLPEEHPDRHPATERGQPGSPDSEET